MPTLYLASSVALITFLATCGARGDGVSEVASDQVNRCLEEIRTKLAAVEMAIENSRNYLNANTRLIDVQEELSKLHANLDKKAGLESIVTHILRENSGLTQESGWNEISCREDADHIPRFDVSLIDTYKHRVKAYVEDEKLPMEQEERFANALYLLGKLQSEFLRQTEQRGLIRAGYWLSARYAERRLASNIMARGFMSDEDEERKKI